MTSPLRRRLTATTTLALLSTLVLAATGARAETGDLWEVTSQMSMEGMPMALPPHTSKTCAAKEWKEPPGGADEQNKCTSSDFKSEGSKVTWKVVCTGEHAMTGVGEITRNGSESYTGTIKFTSAEANMTTKLNGKRVGDCEVATN